MSIPHYQSRHRMAAFAVFACAIVCVYAAPGTGRSSIQAINNCAACHQKIGQEAILYSRSVHAANGISCGRCHGGDASASEKETAHSGRFIGKPDVSQIIKTCGSCHSAELGLFKTSKHFPDKKAIARLDCVQCHGAHTTGSPTRNFSYAYFCSGCHGLEYLPELNRPFQQMLEAVDSQNEAIDELRRSGSKSNGQAIAIRKQTRKIVASIVHGTDYEAGREKIPELLKLNEQFRREVGSRQ